VTQGLTIRPANDDELDIIASLTVDAFAEHAAAMSPDAWSTFAQDIANVRGRVGDGQVLVALSDGRIVGAVTIFQHWRGAQSDALGLRMLAVPPAFRGSGIGRALMEHCVDVARDQGKGRVVLTVVQEMEVARDLTERMGFVRAPGLDHEPAPGVRMHGYQLVL
jgi:GNAT superfamily N-acetyltransferase